MTRVDSPVPLMRHDPDRSWITHPDPDHPKGTQPSLQVGINTNVECQKRTIFAKA